MKQLAVGIDIGGTKISIAIGSTTGKILHYVVFPTLKGKRAQEGVRQIVSETRKLIAQLSPAQRKNLLGIGVCLPGAVNTRQGLAPHSPNLPGWKGLRLGHILQTALKLPVRLVNDANAAAMAESHFGAGRGFQDFIYITVSTGVGGGIYVGGHLVEGTSFVAGEIGHMTLVAGGDVCSCGRRGCFEAYASGGSIERYTAAQLKKKKIRGSQAFFKEGKLSARAIKAAAFDGNAFAVHAFERAGSYLGIGLGSLLNVLNPQKIILGGGVLDGAPELFWRAMRKNLKQTAWPEALRAVKIVRTPLKANVGNLGALAVVFNSFPALSRTE